MKLWESADGRLDNKPITVLRVLDLRKADAEVVHKFDRPLYFSLDEKINENEWAENLPVAEVANAYAEYNDRCMALANVAHREMQDIRDRYAGMRDSVATEIISRLKGDAEPVYVEPRIVTTPFKFPED